MIITAHMNEALRIYSKCVKNNNILTNTGYPDPYHIMEYPIFLYILGRTIYERKITDTYRIKDRLHSLNKALHGCSIYHTTKLPEEFFLNYATGVVLAPATYGNQFTAYHGVSVTENNGILPTIGNRVTLMPNVTISGNSTIGNNVTISVGTTVIDKSIPDNSLVFQSPTGGVIIKEAKKDYAGKYFSRSLPN